MGISLHLSLILCFAGQISSQPMEAPPSGTGEGRPADLSRITEGEAQADWTGVPSERSDRSSFTAEPPSASAVEAASMTSPRLLPPDLVARALAVPPEASLPGQPWTLSRALSASRDRRQQLAVVHAYWQLAETVAKYHYARQKVERLETLQSRTGEQPALRAAQSAATARRREAELAVMQAQHEFAARAQLSPSSPLPLPGDPPHVGAYRTRFQDVFAQRSPPERARVIDRTLPLRRVAIDGRAAAMLAAADAWTAAEDDYRADRTDLTVLIAAVEKLFHQQTAFIEVVCRYNHDIAEYAFAVAPPGLSPQQLAGSLIQPASSRPSATPTLSDPAVLRAGHLQPEYAPEAVPGENRPLPALPEAGRLVPVLPPPSEAVESGDTVPREDATRRESAGEPNPQTEVPATGASSPLPYSPYRDPSVPQNNRPTPARRPPSQSDSTREEPFTISPVPAAPIRPEDLPPDATPQPTPAPPPEEAPSDSSAETSDSRTSTSARRLVRKSVVAVEPAEALANHQPLENPEESAEDVVLRTQGLSPASVALYPALQKADPLVQAKQLTLALHWDRALPADAGRPMPLTECLSRLPGGGRKAALSAYWTLRQRAVEYQVLVQQQEFLDSLKPKALERRRAPSGATEMLELHAAQLDVKAALPEAHARLIEAQFELARLTQDTAAAQWPLATTVPHFGQYLLKFGAQSRGIVESWPMRRLAAAIPQWSTCLQERAAAVIMADAARADAAVQFDAGRVELSTVLDRIVAQTRHTLEFLQTQTDYNRAIAEYALAVLPSEIPPAQLVASLVVKP